MEKSDWRAADGNIQSVVEMVADLQTIEAHLAQRRRELTERVLCLDALDEELGKIMTAIGRRS